ncbi:hypothetical protein BB558_002763 [Smittium angustum]|uniref:t-SNARE coiled-coil homology domain-containing protein n=1 Tax=Smittium angustum TaxID=133377 RepID=A0A2U1J878_SMIAN|nr:hypothetical protein BB558_002763 [Smittium angustum]
MEFNNRTLEFFKIVSEKTQDITNHPLPLENYKGIRNRFKKNLEENNKPINEKKTHLDSTTKKNSLEEITKSAYGLNDQLVLVETFLRNIRPSYLHLNQYSSGVILKNVVDASLLEKFVGDRVPESKKLESVDLVNLFSKKKLNELERDQIDNFAKQTIRNLFKQIQELEKLSGMVVENLKQDENLSVAEQAKDIFKRAIKAFDPRTTNLKDTSNKNSSSYSHEGYLRSWEVLQLHYSGITWWLSKRLMNISKVQIKMEEQRLAQASLKSTQSKVIISNTTENSFQSDKNTHLIDNLPENERVQLMEENRALLNEFERTTDHVLQTQKTLLEISSIQSQMSMHLSKQLEQTEQLYNESYLAKSNIEQGNQSLYSAKKHMGDARRWTLMIILLLCFVLLFLDWFD